MVVYPQLTYIELCAGTGMLGTAIEIALESIGIGAVPVCYVEREAFAAATLVARMEETRMGFAPIWDDVTTFDGTAWRGVVDIVCGGYPCQPFSFAGKRLAEKDERHIWPDIRRIVEEIKPGICFFENVPGHVSKGLGTVIGDLRSLGYSVTPGLFESKEIGAPMENRRLFILATTANGECGTGNPETDGVIRESGSSIRNVDNSSFIMGKAANEQRDSMPGTYRQGIEVGGSNRGMETTASDRCEGRNAETRQRRFQKVDESGNWMGASEGERGEFGEVPDGSEGNEEFNSEWADRQIREWHFPPGRNDRYSWERVAELEPSKMPAIKSEIRGMALGMASRADQLRIIGNGVEPLAAAYAFLTLLACA